MNLVKNNFSGNKKPRNTGLKTNYYENSLPYEHLY